MYPYGYGMEESIMEFMEEFGFAIIGAIAGVLLITLVIGILVYVFQSVGLYTIAKRRGIRNAWLAWIPVGCYWIAGSIADQYRYVAKGQIKNKRKVLLGLNIAAAAATLVMNVISSVLTIALVESDVESAMAANSSIRVLTSLITSGLNIAVLVFWHMALYDIYSSCSPENNVVFLVLGIIFSITIPFFLFCSRKKDGGMPPRRPEPQTYAYQQPEFAQPAEPWNDPERF